MDDAVVALTTVPGDFDAAGLAERLVTAGVAACVSVLPAVESIYVWDGALQRDREQQLVIKTTRAASAALWDLLKSHHPYDLPEFIVLATIDGNPQYLEWVKSQVRRER